jgi:hypothetical protein
LVIKNFIPSSFVIDIDETREKLIEAGGQSLREFRRHHVFYASDPFGIIFDVIERKQ